MQRFSENNFYNSFVTRRFCIPLLFSPTYFIVTHTKKISAMINIPKQSCTNFKKFFFYRDFFILYRLRIHFNLTQLNFIYSLTSILLISFWIEFKLFCIYFRVITFLLRFVNNNWLVYLETSFGPNEQILSNIRWFGKKKLTKFSQPRRTYFIEKLTTNFEDRRNIYSILDCFRNKTDDLNHIFRDVRIGCVRQPLRNRKAKRWTANYTLIREADLKANGMPTARGWRIYICHHLRMVQHGCVCLTPICSTLHG